MNIFLFYVYVVLNFIGTLFLKLKLNYLKKYGTKEEAEDYLNKIVSKWSRNILDKAGVKVNVTGNENLPEGNCLFVSNHQGNFDFFAILGYVNKPMGFVAKKEILKIKIASTWMKEIHCVFIDRENIRESVKAIKEAIENLKNGYSMAIFPEGTRSKGHNIGEFKKGSLKLGTKTDVPIVPITVDGSYKIFEENDGKKIVPSEIRLIIGKPLYAKDFSVEEKKNLAGTIHNIIKNNLDNM